LKLSEIGGSLADIHLTYADPSTHTEPPKVAEVNPLDLRGEELIDYYEIRKATLIDIPQIAAIYNYYVVNEPLFPGEDKELSEQSFVTQFYSLDARHAILVLVLTKPLGHYPVGFVAGYIINHPFSSKSTTAHVVESGIFIHHEFKSKGMGVPLAVTGGEFCYQNGFDILINRILEVNKASIGITEKLGYFKVGQFQGIQQIKGKRYDVLCYQKDLKKDRERDYHNVKIILSAIHQNVVTIDK